MRAVHSASEEVRARVCEDESRSLLRSGAEQDGSGTFSMLEIKLSRFSLLSSLKTITVISTGILLRDGERPSLVSDARFLLEDCRQQRNRRSVHDGRVSLSL